MALVTSSGQRWQHGFTLKTIRNAIIPPGRVTNICGCYDPSRVSRRVTDENLKLSIAFGSVPLSLLLPSVVWFIVQCGDRNRLCSIARCQRFARQLDLDHEY